MTKRYEITKTLGRIVKGTEKSNGVVFCIGEECNLIRHKGEWSQYRNLTNREKECCSSGLCKDCFDYAMKLNYNLKIKELFGAKDDE